MTSKHLILYHLLLLPWIFPSFRVFFPASQFFASGSLSIGASALTSVFPMNIWDWFPLGLTSFQSMTAVHGLLRVFSNTTVQKHEFFGTQLFFMVQISHPYITTGKTIALIRQTFFSKVMSVSFNILSRFSPKEQASFNFMVAATICSGFGAQENKVCYFNMITVNHLLFYYLNLL